MTEEQMNDLVNFWKSKYEIQTKKLIGVLDCFQMLRKVFVMSDKQEIKDHISTINSKMEELNAL
jgi:hypothetical protein